MSKQDLAKKLIISQIEMCLNELGNKVLKRVANDEDELLDFGNNPFAYMAEVCDDLADAFDEVENSLTEEQKQTLKDEAEAFLDQKMLEHSDEDEDDDITKH